MVVAARNYHYLPPSEYSPAAPDLIELVAAGLSDFGEPVERGASWTTDAPFRETAMAINAAREKGILAVEMEAAALYAFAQARRKPVVCFAHVTNRMGRIEGDLKKGEAEGAMAALALVHAVAEAGTVHRSEPRCP